MDCSGHYSGHVPLAQLSWCQMQLCRLAWNLKCSMCFSTSLATSLVSTSSLKANYSRHRCPGVQHSAWWRCRPLPAFPSAQLLSAFCRAVPNCHLFQRRLSQLSLHTHSDSWKVADIHLITQLMVCLWLAGLLQTHGWYFILITALFKALVASAGHIAQLPWRLQNECSLLWVICDQPWHRSRVKSVYTFEHYVSSLVAGAGDIAQ